MARINQYKKFIKNDEVKKSPRTLEEILGTSKKENIIIKYHLVAGCFSNHINASRLVSNLVNQNYPSKIIGKNKQGLYLVSYETFYSIEKASRKRDFILSELVS